MQPKSMILGAAMAFALATPVFAAEGQATTAAPAPAAPAVHDAQLASDLQGVLEVMYADIEKLKQNRSITTNKVLAVGAGAGLGYILGGMITGGFIGPAMSSLATTVGFSPATAGTLSSTVTTMGTFAATYAGGVAGDALIE